LTYASGEFRTLNRTSCRSMVYRQLTAYRWAARNDGRSAEGFAPCLMSFRKSVAVSPPLPDGELDFKSAGIKSIIWAATTGPTPGVPARRCIHRLSGGSSRIPSIISECCRLRTSLSREAPNSQQLDLSFQGLSIRSSKSSPTIIFPGADMAREILHAYWMFNSLRTSFTNRISITSS
jgi:hypothetical protein